MVTFGPGLPAVGGAILPGLGLVDAATVGQSPDRRGDREAVSSGWPALDGLLPGGGVRRGSLIEWLAGAAGAGGCGAATLACAVACRLAAPRRTGRGGVIVVVDRAGWFHPPAVLPWLGAGAAGRLVVARPSRDDDEIWAIDQALRCVGVAAVVAWPRLAAAWSLERGAAVARRCGDHGGLGRWLTAMRRWQLAARSGGAVGLFVRPLAALPEPSWAESRLAVAALPGGSLLERRLRIERVGGAWCGIDAGRPAEIVIDMARGASTGRAVATGVGMPAVRRREAARSDMGMEGGASCRAS